MPSKDPHGPHALNYREVSTPAVIYIVISSFMFASSGVVIKILASDMSTPILVFWRNLFSLSALLVWLSAFGFPNLRTSRLRAHCFRALFSYGALLAYFYAVREINLANAVLLQSSAPIFVPILALVIYRRVSDRFVWTGMTLGLVGIAIVVEPKAMGVNPGDMSGVASGLFGGLATMVIWNLSSTEPASRQMFYFTALTLLISVVPLPWIWKMPAHSDIPLLIALGVLTMLAQYFLSLGCGVAATDKIVSWSYTSVVFSAALGYAFWGEAISPMGCIGMVMVVVGAYWAIKNKGTMSGHRLRGRQT